jgi:hypothetical protein
MTIIAIGWTRGNKKALATILPTQYSNKLRALSNFDYHDISATHKIMKRDVGIGYTIMKKYKTKELRNDSRCTDFEFVYPFDDLNEAKQALTTTQISELIFHTGYIYVN